MTTWSGEAARPRSRPASVTLSFLNLAGVRKIEGKSGRLDNYSDRLLQRGSARRAYGAYERIRDSRWSSSCHNGIPKSEGRSRTP